MATDVLKKELRLSMNALRRSLSHNDWLGLSHAAQQCVLNLPQWPGAREVMLYSAYNRECDTSLLRDTALEQGKRVLMPRCRPGEDGVMDVACITCVEELVPGKYGIPEPDPLRCVALSSLAPDIMVLPGLAFDARGHRLGWGGGYYDRFLAAQQQHPALLVGLAFPFQMIEQVPSQAWDHPVDLVCTGE